MEFLLFNIQHPSQDLVGSVETWFLQLETLKYSLSHDRSRNTGVEKLQDMGFHNCLQLSEEIYITGGESWGSITVTQSEKIYIIGEYHGKCLYWQLLHQICKCWCNACSVTQCKWCHTRVENIMPLPKVFMPASLQRKWNRKHSFISWQWTNNWDISWMLGGGICLMVDPGNGGRWYSVRWLSHNIHSNS